MDCKTKQHASLIVKLVVSSLVPRPPPLFGPWFTFSIIQGSRTAVKNGRGLGTLSNDMDVR